MDEAVELHGSEVAATELVDQAIHIEFSRVYIRSAGCGWTQAARIRVEHGEVLREPADYPRTVLACSLKSDYEQFDNCVPLPFSRPGRFTIRIVFANSVQLRVVGHNPMIELVGDKSTPEQLSAIP